MKRATRRGLERNAAVVLGDAGTSSGVPALVSALDVNRGQGGSLGRLVRRQLSALAREIRAPGRLAN